MPGFAQPDKAAMLKKKDQCVPHGVSEMVGLKERLNE